MLTISGFISAILSGVWTIIFFGSLLVIWESRHAIWAGIRTNHSDGRKWLRLFGWSLVAFGPPVMAIWSFLEGVSLFESGTATLGISSIATFSLLLGMILGTARRAIFTRRVRSLDDFVSIVRRTRRPVLIEPMCKVIRVNEPDTVVSFWLRFTSRAFYRRIVYEEHILDDCRERGSFADDIDSGELDHAEEAFASLDIVADQRITDLHFMIPGVPVKLSEKMV